MRPFFRLAWFLLIGFSVASASCRPPGPVDTPAPPGRNEAGEWEVSPDLQVAELAPGVWLHRSWQRLQDGTPFPSNGLIVREGDRLLLVDTAWGEETTRLLLGWIDATLRLPVAHAVVTHSHDDRLGGAPVLVERGIPFFSQPLTRDLAGKQGLPLPEALAELAAVGGTARVGSAEIFYPGPAHAPDNVVVWLEGPGVLFGGCAVRSSTATALGNVADADLTAWPGFVRRVMERYGAARTVVPGHGRAGGPELLKRTLELLEPAAPAQ